MIHASQGHAAVVRVTRLACAVASCLLAACATPPAADPADDVQAFVSAAVLAHWCRSHQPLDVEACLSYLRGNFDTLSAIRSRQALADDSCVPTTVAVTVLRAHVRERTRQPADGLVPAARMLEALWRRHYPCG